MADIPNVVGAGGPEVEEVVGGAEANVAQANRAGGPGRLTWKKCHVWVHLAWLF
jgi:hypothetical protein